MAADASIYGQIKPAQPLEGPLDQFGKVLNLKALMGQGRLQELQTQNLEQNMGEEQAVRDVFKNAPPGGSLESLVPNVLRASPKAGIDLQGKVIKNKQESAALDKTNLEVSAAKAKDARDGLAGVTDQPSYDAWRQSGAQKGYQVAQNAPPQFDLAWQKQHLMTADQFIQNVEHEKNRALTTEGHAITKRGQDMTDARQRELNGIMEGQSSTPSPALVDAIGKHEIELKPPPTNTRNPIMLQRYGQTLEAVKAKYPNWGAEQFPTVKKVEASFAAGPDAKTIQSLSNATGHLDTYEKLALAMKNGDSQMVNSIVNKVREQFGSDAPTNPQAVSQFLSAEIVKAASGAAGGVSDREHMASVFANKSSPAQMVGAANTVREIMGQQFRSLEQKYKSGTYGRSDFADKYLTLPEVRSAYERANKAHAATDVKPTVPASGKLVPATGTVQDGFRFKGGDPAKQESWEKV